jgi:hypothetical protein
MSMREGKIITAFRAIDSNPDPLANNRSILPISFTNFAPSAPRGTGKKDLFQLATDP